MDVSLKYGTSSKEISIPDKNDRGSITPLDREGVRDTTEEVRRALREPIGEGRIRERFTHHKRVVLLVSDITRPSPSSILLPPIIEELNEAGITDEKIKIIFGLGIHRRQTEEEKKSLVGPEIYQRIQSIDHDVENCKEVGRTKRGTPIQVFREVLEADLLIATGNLEFHYFAGFSGGAKALCPGVCSRETIAANHRLLLEKGAVGGRIKGNPVREDLEEVGEIVGVDYMVNAILNSRKEIVKVVAGHVEKAHRAGVEYINEMFAIELLSPADIVITTPGGFPKDIDLYQSHKALENASLAVKENGIIIMGAQCRDGLGEEIFGNAFLEGKTPEELILELKKDFILGRHKASRIAGIHKRSPIFLVSDLSKEIEDQLFFPTFSSLEEALEEALRIKGEEAQVLVMPYGISTLPLMKK